MCLDVIRVISFFLIREGKVWNVSRTIDYTLDMNPDEKLFYVFYSTFINSF